MPRSHSVVMLLVRVILLLRALLLGYVVFAKWRPMERVAPVLATLLLILPRVTLTAGILIILVLELWYAAKMAHVNRIHRLVQKYDYPLSYNIINHIIKFM